MPDILQAVSESLIENEVKDITGFDVTDTANITLNYDNRIIVNIGLPEDVDYKIKTAMAIINEKLDPNGSKTITGTLDVSTANTNKVSRYLPFEETVPVTTEPQTTVPMGEDGIYDWSQDTYTDGEYSEDAYVLDDSGWNDVSTDVW